MIRSLRASRSYVATGCWFIAPGLRHRGGRRFQLTGFV